MADFDLEQLKTIIENLGDKLEKTKGDQLSRDELYRIRMVLTKMSGSIGKTDSATQDRKTIISELVKEMRKANPGGAGRPIESPTTKRGTIIREEQARRQGGREGNTVLDQILRKAGDEANEFSKAVDGAGKNTKTFSDRVAASAGSFGAVSSAATAFVTKTLGVGGERVDLYRELLASGEGTVSSMQDMGRQAAAAGMTVKQFVEAMSQGSQGARQLGAIKFGDVRKTVLEMSRASGYMGMLPDQITNVTSTYAEILRNQGAGQNRSSEQMASGIINLVKTSETTAHILGQTREEALEAQKLASADYQFQAAADSNGFDSVTASAVRDIFKNNFGDVGVQAITDQLTFGQVVNKPAADLVATNPDLQRVLALSESMLKSGASEADIQIAVARALKDNGSILANNKDQQRTFAQIAGLEGNALSGALRANLQNRFVSQSNNTDRNFNRGTDQNQNEEQRAGVGALQVAESFNKIQVAADAAITAVFNPMVDTFGPKLRDDVLPALDAFSEGLTNAAIDLSGQTTVMATLGTTALAVAGGLALFGGGLTVATGLFRGLGAIRGLGSLFGAGAGASGAGGAAAGGALATGAAVAGGVLAGGVGMWAGGNMVNNRKNDESFFGTGARDGGFFGSRATGYGTAAAGGALTGAAIGSVIPGVGTLIGAGVGAAVGTGYAWWNDESGTAQQPAGGRRPGMPGDASRAPQSSRAGSSVPTGRQAPPPANATGQKGKSTLSSDQMTNKIMEASERSAGLLKQIKDNGDKHLEAVREEIAVIRSMSDRLSRLLEDGNKNTKSISEHSI